MTNNRTLLIISILLLAVSACIEREPSTSLERSTPEAEGVSSAAIIEFVDAVEQSDHEFHSFMFLRHGKVIAEGWWDPYAPDLKHTMYSTSKSFTSTAIGFAVSEGLISVDDKVVSFFRDDLPDSISPYLAQLAIKHVISMTTGQDPDPTGIVMRDSNWVETFLATPIVNEPGSTFLYNTLGTYILSAIVSEVTGEAVIDYLTPRLFEPLGITDIDWEVDPQGRNTGGWGLRIRTEGMAKFGQLFLQQGMWNGEQILPQSWVQEATSASILQSPEAPDSIRDSSDWLQGYGYQFWRSRNNAYRGDGAFGQFIIVMPDQHAVIVITSESADMQGEINLVWEYLLPAMQESALPEDPETEARLRDRLAGLALRPPERTETPSQAVDISGKTYSIAPNDRGIESLSFAFTGDECTVTEESARGEFTIEFANGAWRHGETTRMGPYLLTTAKAAYVGLPPLRIVGACGWDDEQTLRLVLRYIESPHTETVIAAFDGDEIAVTVMSSFAPPPDEPTLVGSVAN
ncbi:MAG: serine hydrolase [Gemmatimonadota bacterium]|nr:MAG: serine hydrolase [Gemmatimonadota bacterium]